MHWQKGIGTANTSVVFHGGRLQALQETDSPCEVRDGFLLLHAWLKSGRFSASDLIHSLPFVSGSLPLSMADESAGSGPL